MKEGIIKKWFDDRGYGFVKVQGEKDHFLLISSVREGKPREGAKVRFASRAGKKGPVAADVVVLQNGGNRANRAGASSGKRFPYTFTLRPGENGLKQPASRFHHCLEQDCFDMALEVEWQALTPVAANPCTDPAAGPTCPVNDDKHYQGYDKRWLMMDNRLAISPFTVKSAVANGFAALLGSCYRVISTVEEHRDQDTYPYNGAWKRYRVAMNNSKPGILKHFDPETGDVVIEQVEEYYYDQPALPAEYRLAPGNTCYVRFNKKNRKKIIDPQSFDTLPYSRAVEVTYYGPYRFGMDLTLQPGQHGKKHYHRFYRLQGRMIKGRVGKINLESLEKQKTMVYMGVFRRLNSNNDPRGLLEGHPWHQDLTSLKKGDFIYYQSFDNKVTAIGKNFQFKTAFHHAETVPEPQQACCGTDQLCPRCALFGMVGSSDDTVGLKGRFQASALVNDLQVQEKELKARIPQKNGSHATVTLKEWRSSDNSVARQVLLPVMGPPKPNKRDVENGYFRKEDGMIRGAKVYCHAPWTMENLLAFIEKKVNRWRTLKDIYDRTGNRSLNKIDYSHELRNYAQVCREGLVFRGTLGVENCSPNEAAALLMILDHRTGGHGFKIGLGKSLGLGSMISAVRAVWIRRPDHYDKWQRLEMPKDGMDAILAKLPGKIAKHLEDLRRVRDQLNRVDPEELARQDFRLEFPAPGHKYWKEAGK
jgi:CspA family cold shock protein